MHRIDGPGATAGNLFTQGSSTLGVAPTQVTDAWLNDFQENDCEVVESAGIVLVKGDKTQLRRAIERIARRTTAFRNLLLNGDFQITQDAIDSATSLTSNPKYGPDGWILDANGNASFSGIMSRWQGGTALAPSNPPAMLTLRCPSNASGPPCYLRQRIEDVRTLAGQKGTCSFWARVKTTPMASATANFTPKLRQYHGVGGGPASDVVLTGTTFPLTTTLQYFTYTFDVPVPGQIGTTGYPGLTSVGTTLAEQETLHYLELSFELDGWNAIGVDVQVLDLQLEPGGSASDFERRSFWLELALAQRYFEKSAESFLSGAGIATAAPRYEGCSSGTESGTIAQGLQTRFRVPKARRPVVKWYSPETGANTGTLGSIYWEGADRAVSAINYLSTENTGQPVVAASRANSGVYGHWTADARL